MGGYGFVKKENERCLMERLKRNPDLVSRKQVMEIVNDWLNEMWLDEEYVYDIKDRLRHM